MSRPFSSPIAPSLRALCLAALAGCAVLSGCAASLNDPGSFAGAAGASGAAGESGGGAPGVGGGGQGGAAAGGAGAGGADPAGGAGGAGPSGGGAGAPPGPGDAAAGQMVFSGNSCSSCHKDDLSGGGIPGAGNITPDPDHGLGMWSDDEIKTVLLTGVKKNGSMVCASMAQYKSLSSTDLSNLVAYMRSVPASTNDPGVCK